MKLLGLAQLLALALAVSHFLKLTARLLTAFSCISVVAAAANTSADGFVAIAQQQQQQLHFYICVLNVTHKLRATKRER